MTHLRLGLVAYALDRTLAGIGRYTVELARALAGLGEDLEVTLLTAGGPGPLAEVGGLREDTPQDVINAVDTVLINDEMPWGITTVELLHERVKEAHRLIAKSGTKLPETERRVNKWASRISAPGST